MQNEILPTIVSLNTLALGALAWLQWRTAVGQRNISEEQKTIADSQRRIAEQKLKLDLFDRRFKIYSAIREFASGLFMYGEVTSDMIVTFVCDTSEADFFFEPEVTRFKDDLHELAKQSVSILGRSSTYPPESEMHKDLAEQRGRIREAAEQKYNEMTKLFHPYLGFNRLKNI